MRSNILNIEITQRMMNRFSQVSETAVRRILHTAKNCLTLGVGGRKWVAIWLIGLLLSPIFSLPVSASVVIGTTDSNLNRFEPVNAPQPFWETAYFNIQAEVEEWLTVRRNDNSPIAADEADEKDKKEIESRESRVESSNSSIDKEFDAKKAKLEKNKTATSAEIDKSAEKEKTETAKTNGAAVTVKTTRAASPVLAVSQLPDGERESVFAYENNLGAPPGQTEMDSTNSAAAIEIRHRAGIANFSFGIPLA